MVQRDKGDRAVLVDNLAKTRKELDDLKVLFVVVYNECYAYVCHRTTPHLMFVRVRNNVCQCMCVNVCVCVCAFVCFVMSVFFMCLPERFCVCGTVGYRYR